MGRPYKNVAKLPVEKFRINIKRKKYLNIKAKVILYYSFLHSYLNYGNATWCSTSIT